MRIATPIGFVITLISIILSGIQRTLSPLINFLLYLLPLTFFIIGLISLLSMIIFTFVLDSPNAKSNGLIKYAITFVNYLSLFLF